MLRRLTKFGEPVLKAKAKEVEVFDESVEQLGKDLVETMYEENGLGLAAPQIDVSKRMFAIDMRRRANEKINRIMSPQTVALQHKDLYESLLKKQ